MSNAETTLLYTLSTLAQTCAALAAFVGAVGLYNLQSLRNERRDVYDDINATIGRQLPSDQLIAEARARGVGYPALRALLDRYDALPGVIRKSAAWLIFFEGWNLLVIVASLVGFNYVSAWAGAPWLSYALWFVAVLTALITVGSVWVWTRGVET